MSMNILAGVLNDFGQDQIQNTYWPDECLLNVPDHATKRNLYLEQSQLLFHSTAQCIGEQSSMFRIEDHAARVMASMPI